MPIDVLGLITQFTSSKITTTEERKAERKPSLKDVARTMPTAYAQQRARAGLLVTDELDKAVARCKAKVERISAMCRRRNMKFRDIEFDLEEDRERCLHGLNTPPADKFEPADVLRVSQIFEDPQFIIEGATSGDIVQGDIGNCWFLSALAVASTVPGLIERFCVARDERVGVYGFIFYRDCGWVDVVVDDLLYVSIPKYEELSPKEKKLYHEDKDFFLRVARRGSKSLYFAKSGTENETWVPLIEKAFAKLHGDYASIQGGFASEGVEDLTGGVSTVIHTSDVLDPDRFWNDELMRANTDRLFGCYIFRLPMSGSVNPGTTINGLMTSHAYSIIKCVEHRGKRFLRIRNPWGHGEWTGRWADGSREWQGEWLEKETLDALGHKFGDDGEFVMEYEDFLKTWTMVERSRLFDETWRMSSLWLNVSSLPPPSAWVFGDVSFTFSLPAPSLCVVVLAQLDARYFREISGYSQWSLEFILFKRDEPEPLGTSVHSNFWGRSVNLEVHLEKGDYVVHVRMDRRAIRQKDYFKEGLPSWDWRKLGRVWSQAALSQSIAANFDPEYYRDLLPVPIDKYAGRDLTRLELESHDAVQRKRETLRSVLQAHDDTPSTATAPGFPADTPYKTVEKTTTEAVVTSSLMVVRDEPDTPVVASPPMPVSEATSGDDLLAPTVFVDAPEDREEGDDDEEDMELDSDQDEPPAHHLHTDDEPVHPADMKGGETTPQQAPREDMPRSPTDMTVHPDYICDGCQMSPIVGVMYVCMHPSCPDYQLCARCVDAGVHQRDHVFMRIEQPGDMQKMQRTSMPGDGDDVVLGLRVYSHRDAPATIAGQLRHGRVVQWSKEG